MASIFDGAQQKAGDRSLTWLWDGPRNVERSNGERWGTRVRLWARHDKDRKRFVCTVSVSEYSVQRGYTMESFDVYGQPAVLVLAAPVARYSVGAFSQFLADVRDKAENLAAYGSDGSGGEILRHGVQLVNGSVPA